MTLIFNHIYSVLNTTDASTKEFILQRNQHGSSGWTDIYAYGGDRSISKLRGAIKAEEKKKINFWMDFEEYFAFFDFTFIFHNERSFLSQNYKIQNSDFGAGLQYIFFVVIVIQVTDEKARLFMNYVLNCRELYWRKEEVTEHKRLLVD